MPDWLLIIHGELKGVYYISIAGIQSIGFSKVLYISYVGKMNTRSTKIEVNVIR